MKKQINERILKTYGSVIISRRQGILLAKKLKDEGDIRLILIGGVEGIEDKPTHTDGMLDCYFKVKMVRVESIKPC